MTPSPSVHEHWSSRFGFLMAAIGSSVGLGNFWRFPYTAGENGGAIFVIVYLLCILLVAFPVLVSEYAIGRRGGMSAMGSTAAVAREAGVSRHWGLLGWVGAIGAFLILSFYSVVAGWVLIYIFKAFSGQFAGLSPEEIRSSYEALLAAGGGSGLNPATASSTDMYAELLGEDFGATISNGPLVVGAHLVFMAITTFIVARGVQGGIETAVKILMPAFFVMLLGVVLFNAFAGNFGAAVSYLFQPQPCVLFDAPSIEGAANACGAPEGAETRFNIMNFLPILSSALGQAFFSVGVGVGLMITYGAYLNKDEQITGNARIVAGSDTLVALIAGFAIFPIVFGFGMSPNGGPGLFFVTLPAAFSQLPSILAVALAGIFFTLAFFAAITSSISLLEVSVSRAEERFPGKRVPVAIALGGVCFLIGVANALDLNVFDFFDQLTEKLFLPLGGLLIALFAGWAVRKEIFRAELTQTTDGMFTFWHVLIRWVAPIGTAVILASSLWLLITNPPALVASAASALGFGG